MNAAYMRLRLICDNDIYYNIVELLRVNYARMCYNSNA